MKLIKFFCDSFPEDFEDGELEQKSDDELGEIRVFDLIYLLILI